MDQLEALSKKLGRLKGATALYREARKAGIDVTRDQVKDVVEAIGTKQVLAPGPSSLGKSATSAEHNEGSRWQCDLVQFRGSLQEEQDEKKEEGDDGVKHYMLLVVNVFTRKCHGVVLEDKRAESVLEGMRRPFQ